MRARGLRPTDRSSCLRAEHLAAALRIDSSHPTAMWLLAIVEHLTGGVDAEPLARRALELNRDFGSLLVFALTRPRDFLPGDGVGPLQALTLALDEASPFDRDNDLELVVYAVRVLQAVHGEQAVRAAVLASSSAVWEILRQAIAPLVQSPAPMQDQSKDAAIVRALNSSVLPKEQLLAAWAAGQSISRESVQSV